MKIKSAQKIKIFLFDVLGAIAVMVILVFFLQSTKSHALDSLFFPISWFCQILRKHQVSESIIVLSVIFFMFLELLLIVVLLNPIFLALIRFWDGQAQVIKNRLKTAGKWLLGAFLLLVLVLAGRQIHKVNKAADLKHFHDAAYQEILKGLMSEEIGELWYNRIIKNFTPEEKEKSEVEWCDGELNGRPISLCKVIIGGKYWVGLGLGIEGYADRETRYYSIEKKGEQWRIRQFFKATDTLGRASFLTNKELLGTHLQVVVRSDNNSHYFSWNEGKGFFKVLDCPDGYQYAHSMPPPTCTEDWNSVITSEAGDQLKVITHWRKCVLPPNPEYEEFSEGMSQVVYVNKDFPVTQLYQWIPVDGEYKKIK